MVHHSSANAKLSKGRLFKTIPSGRFFRSIFDPITEIDLLLMKYTTYYLSHSQKLNLLQLVFTSAIVPMDETIQKNIWFKNNNSNFKLRIE